ncbi:hypothetical protein ANTRET_LOCUS3585 [Anthophora retusa]
MVNINPINVITLLSVAFIEWDQGPTPINSAEENLRDVLFDLIVRSVEDTAFLVEHETCVEMDGTPIEQEIQDANLNWLDEEEENRTPNVSNIYEENVICHSNKEYIPFEYKRKAVAYWNSGKSKRLKLDTVRSKFRHVKSERMLRKWALQVEQGGTKKEKIKRIEEYTFNKFMEARQLRVIVHEVDLRRWALQARDIENLQTFKAGHTWLHIFKKTFRLVSRKITRFVITNMVNEENDIHLHCSAFVNEVKSYIARNEPLNVYNSDQSGFNLELHSGRTLAEEGIKIVEGGVQSVSSTTHSYTIQPTISADGQLLSPLFIVLKESTGHFGPIVEKHLFRPDNVYLAASKSGKLTTDHFKTWLREIYFANTGPTTVLILDSWSGHCNKTVNEVTPEGKNVKLFIIPKGGTKYVQPLDVYGFRTWKNFVRRFSDIVLILNHDINLHARNNIIKLQSLVHNQFSSPRFQNFIKYSWYKSGYIDEKPNASQNPVEYCYSVENEPRCHICGDVAIIKCAWCKKSLCLKHFFDEYHYCRNYIE